MQIDRHKTLIAFSMAALIALPAAAQFAQQEQPNNVEFDDAPWEESKAPPAPAFNPNKLIEVDMPITSSLHLGVDPDTITLSRKDAIVRYVVVASSSRGAVNAFYEGIRCATGEMKTYARYTGGEWHKASDNEWRRMLNMPSSHTWRIARQGVCVGRSPRLEIKAMVQHLSHPFPNDANSSH